jgi:LmbE family N-acetylglucosaminyl deacetylase
MKMDKPRPAFLENSVIVVCHPDDEVLWFGSILKHVDTVIVAYEDFWAQPGIGSARAAALADYPRAIESLVLQESGSYGQADWSNPVITEYGIGFRTTTSGLRELKRRMRRATARMLGAERGIPEISAFDRYRRNAEALAEALRARLTADMNVFTHNPWGEYGHEDHIQMFRVLEKLRAEIGFRLWVSNYCTERSLPLAQRYFQKTPPSGIRLPVDRAFCEQVADTYKRHGCWTWADDWSWFDEEHFLEAPAANARKTPQSHLVPMNMFTIDHTSCSGWMMAAGLSAAGLTMAMTMAE